MKNSIIEEVKQIWEQFLDFLSTSSFRLSFWWLHTSKTEKNKKAKTQNNICTAAELCLWPTTDWLRSCCISLGWKSQVDVDCFFPQFMLSNWNVISFMRFYQPRCCASTLSVMWCSRKTLNIVNNMDEGGHVLFSFATDAALFAGKSILALFTWCGPAMRSEYCILACVCRKHHFLFRSALGSSMQ